MTAPDPQPQPIAEILGTIADIVTKCTATFRKINPRGQRDLVRSSVMGQDRRRPSRCSRIPGGRAAPAGPSFRSSWPGRVAGTHQLSLLLRSISQGARTRAVSHLLEFNRRVGALNFRAWLSERRHMPGFDNTVDGIRRPGGSLCGRKRIFWPTRLQGPQLLGGGHHGRPQSIHQRRRTFHP